MSRQAIRKIESALTEGSMESALATLKQECSIAQLDDVLKALLWCWDKAPHMARDFHQSASDACPMECTEAEDYENRFNTWANIRLSDPLA